MKAGPARREGNDDGPSRREGDDGTQRREGDDEIRILGKREVKVKQAREVEQAREVVRPYPCPRPGCGLCWSKKEDMLRHLVKPIHHGPAIKRLLPLASKSKPYACPICQHTNRDLTSLIRHFAIKCSKYP